MSIKLPFLSATTLLRQNHLRADKNLGQNFLQEPEALEKIIAAAEIEQDDTILEIGPGLGHLTRYLALSAQKVICVELDHDLIPVLQNVLADFPNVRIVENDILKVTPASILEKDDYLVVANVPYYITSAIFRHLLKYKPQPRRIVLTVQKEVAERICAQPGDMSLLALSIQVFGKPKIAGVLNADAFHPIPRVDSAIVRVDMYQNPEIEADLLDKFFHVAKAGFSQKRKTLRNSLSAGLQLSTQQTAQILENNGIDPMRRAETLDIKEWATLTSAFSHNQAS